MLRGLFRVLIMEAGKMLSLSLGKARLLAIAKANSLDEPCVGPTSSLRPGDLGQRTEQPQPRTSDLSRHGTYMYDLSRLLQMYTHLQRDIPPLNSILPFDGQCLDLAVSTKYVIWDSTRFQLQILSYLDILRKKLQLFLD